MDSLGMSDVPITPGKESLCGELQYWYRRIAELQAEAEHLTSLANLYDMDYLLRNIMSPSLRTVLTADLLNKKKSSKGRLWSQEDKLMALTIFRRNPRAYRYLCRYLVLPSVRSLERGAWRLPMTPGINRDVFSQLAKDAEKMIKQDKTCIVMFGEMNLKACVWYNRATGQVDGYADCGGGERTKEVADHALVFMVQGLNWPWKQPVAFYFSRHSMKADKLSEIIIEVVGALQKAGFRVLATVCDPGATNTRAIRRLVELNGGTRFSAFFTINGHKISTLYDVPHLFKCLRNNFHDSIYIEWEGKIARWSIITKLWKLNTRFFKMPNFTKDHIHPVGMAKMRVKYAAQVLSNTVAAQLRIVELRNDSELAIPGALDTADVVSAFDSLFDDCNGPSKPKDKSSRRNVSASSGHVERWRKWAAALDGMRHHFVDTRTGEIRSRRPPFVSNFLLTLKALEELWSTLDNKYCFSSLNLRHLNQDPLEILFAVLRDLGGRNTNPAVPLFQAALKLAIFFTRLPWAHSRDSNCKMDEGELAENLRWLLAIGPAKADSQEDESPEEAPNMLYLVDAFDDSDKPEEEGELAVEGPTYVAGYLATKMLKGVECEDCRRCLSTQQRESNPDAPRLVDASAALCHTVDVATKHFLSDIVPNFHLANLRNFAIMQIASIADMSWLTCLVHRATMAKTFYASFAELAIRNECRRINQEIVQQATAARNARPAE